ncbi:MAG: tRNA sulfurtransferase [Promethearchaeota archaeon]
MRSVVIHYSEIATKGDNRPFFERTLVRSVQRATGFKPARNFGRLFIKDIDEREVPGILEGLAATPGVANFGVALKTGLEIDAITAAAGELLVPELNSKVLTTRPNKSFPIGSMEVNRLVGEHFYERGFRVDVHDPQQELHVEVLGKNAYVYVGKTQGIGGLPTGSSGKLLALISGGIDSPVAAYMVMKRDCKVDFVHFHNERAGSFDKVADLVGVLSKFQGPADLHVVPFLALQNQIIMNVPSDVRMIVYRRLMHAIASRLAQGVGAKGLVTGDSVGQVASQTLENLAVVRAASEVPVYSPLVGQCTG